MPPSLCLHLPLAWMIVVEIKHQVRKGVSFPLAWVVMVEASTDMGKYHLHLAWVTVAAVAIEMVKYHFPLAWVVVVVVETLTAKSN